MGIFLAGCFTDSFITFVSMVMAFFMHGGGDNNDSDE